MTEYVSSADGVYDAGPARNYHMFAIDEHIDRFFNSAKLMDIEIPCSKEELKELLASLVLKMDTGNNFVYWACTRGTGIRNHVYKKRTGQSVGHDQAGNTGHLSETD